MDIGSIAPSGIQAGFARLSASGHTVANLTTEAFRPLRTQQSTQRVGGIQAVKVQADTPQAVDVPFEFVEQIPSRGRP